MPAAARACFISDLHLWPDRPRTIERFAAFVERSIHGADALFILGDLFEYWAGDDDLSAPIAVSVCGVLHSAAQRGLRIYFIAGNRDFLIGDAALRALGAEPLADVCVLHLGEMRALLLHGDTLCTDDREYQSFRLQVRSPAWQRGFLAKPLAERHALIADLRARSEDKKSRTAAAIMDANAGAIARAFAEHGAPLIIHGHTHRPARHVTPDGVRWVLPDWDFDEAPFRGGGLLADGSSISPTPA